MQQPIESHLPTTFRVLQYLCADPGQGILLASYPILDLLAFCDADWAYCKDTRRSVTRYFIT